MHLCIYYLVKKQQRIVNRSSDHFMYTNFLGKEVSFKLEFWKMENGIHDVT